MNFPEVSAVSQWSIFKAKLFGTRAVMKDERYEITSVYYKGVTYIIKLKEVSDE